MDPITDLPLLYQVSSCTSCNRSDHGAAVKPRKPSTQPQAATSTDTPIVLTIAGSDSGGGAGIQADIKAMSATGSFACSVITAITSQNTQGVSAIFPIPLDHVESQLDAVFTDLNIVAVKVGMLTDSNIIKVVADKIKQYQPKHLVIDPVMVTHQRRSITGTVGNQHFKRRIDSARRHHYP